MSQLHYKEMEKIIDAIIVPHFPNYTVKITEFGACADTSSCQTQYIQNAIDSVSAKGGGYVVVPSGKFLTGSLELKSDVCLNLKNPDSQLLFTTEMNEDYYPLAFSHWEASPCYNFRALIYAYKAHNIGLTGKGILDAQSSNTNWWSWHHQVENAWSIDKPDLQSNDRIALRAMNQNGIPVKDRIFGNGHFLRPNFIQPIKCSNVILEGVTLKNSPMWQLNPVICDNIIIRNMTLSAHGSNSDGCDPESCTNVLIENCCFDTGDDCISLKSGRDRDGQLASLPCRNIVIRNNIFSDGHGGIALGSEMSGGIESVYADSNRFESPNLTYVLRFKTNARRGGFIKNVWLSNTTATAVGDAVIHGTMLYEDGRNGDTLPVFENITIENLHASGGEYGIFLEAFPEVPIKKLYLNNINIDNVQIPLRALNWGSTVMTDVVINGQIYPHPTDVHINGIPSPNSTLYAKANLFGGLQNSLQYKWMADGNLVGTGSSLYLDHPIANCKTIQLSAHCESSINNRSANNGLIASKSADNVVSMKYHILSDEDLKYARDILFADDLETANDFLLLASRGITSPYMKFSPEAYITRMEMAELLDFFCLKNPSANNINSLPSDIDNNSEVFKIAARVINNEFMAFKHSNTSANKNIFAPDEKISRQEMATIAMQSCGVSYKNASTTRPACHDTNKINPVYATNVSRSLYFQFMSCDDNDNFKPNEYITWRDTVKILSRIVKFACI